MPATKQTAESVLLGQVETVARKLVKIDAEREALLARRRELFEQLRDLPEPCPLKRIAEAAGMKEVGAVSAVLLRNRKAKSK